MAGRDSKAVSPPRGPSGVGTGNTKASSKRAGQTVLSLCGNSAGAGSRDGEDAIGTRADAGGADTPRTPHLPFSVACVTSRETHSVLSQVLSWPGNLYFMQIKAVSVKHTHHLHVQKYYSNSQTEASMSSTGAEGAED